MAHGVMVLCIVDCLSFLALPLNCRFLYVLPLTAVTWVRGVSGELYRAPWRRAHAYLREASRLLGESEYDIALTMAEESAQLALKAVYTRLLGYAPRGAQPA